MYTNVEVFVKVWDDERRSVLNDYRFDGIEASLVYGARRRIRNLSLGDFYVAAYDPIQEYIVAVMTCGGDGAEAPGVIAMTKAVIDELDSCLFDVGISYSHMESLVHYISNGAVLYTDYMDVSIGRGWRSASEGDVEDFFGS